MIFLRCKENIYQISDATAQDCRNQQKSKVYLRNMNKMNKPSVISQVLLRITVLIQIIHDNMAMLTILI